jgi:hypothetical protein
MIFAFGIVFSGIFASAALASDTAEKDALTIWEEDKTHVFSASEVDLNDFSWVARPVVVFANSPLDPAFTEQMEYLTDRPDALEERDVVIIVDTDPESDSALRTKLRPRGFMMVLIGKDGEVKLRKPLPWDVRELSRSIDKMPIRRDEIRRHRLSESGG